MRAYYTVVYRVDGDIAAHDAWWQTIQPLFMADSEPVSVSTISKADEITRLDCVARVIERGLPNAETVEAIKAVLVHPDPLAWWRENGEQPRPPIIIAAGETLTPDPSEAA